MGVDERHVWAGVALAAADRHDVDSGLDELRGVRVAQRMQRDGGEADFLGRAAPSLRQNLKRPGRDIRGGKNQRIIGQLAEAEHIRSSSARAVDSECLDYGIRERNPFLPARVLGALNRMPPASVSPSASRTCPRRAGV